MRIPVYVIVPHRRVTKKNRWPRLRWDMAAIAAVLKKYDYEQGCKPEDQQTDGWFLPCSEEDYKHYCDWLLRGCVSLSLEPWRPGGPGTDLTLEELPGAIVAPDEGWIDAPASSSRSAQVKWQHRCNALIRKYAKTGTNPALFCVIAHICMPAHVERALAQAGIPVLRVNL